MSQADHRGLSIADIAVQRRRRMVLQGVSVGLGPGEIIAIVGPNGAGKTTLLEAVLGVVPLARGALLIDGRAVRSFSERARCFAHLAAEAEPALEMQVDRWVNLVSASTDPSWAACLQQHLGVNLLRGGTAGRLSRGERRRLLLFEALSSSKPFLLLDEPTGVFDPLQLLDVVEVFRRAAARGVGMLVSVHQMSDAEAIATRILILCEGRQVAFGTLAELRELAGLGSRASLQEVFLTLLHTREENEDARA